MQEDEVGLKDYFNIINKRKWIIAVLVLLAALAALVMGYRAPRIFQASSTVKINNSRDSLYPTLAAASTYITNGKLLKKAISKEALEVSSKDIKVDCRPIPDTFFVQITTSYTDPDKAQLVANALAKEFVEETSNERIQKMLMNWSESAKKRMKAIEDEINAISEELEKILSSIDELKSGRTSTSETALRLSSLEEQRIDLEANLSRLKSEQVSLTEKAFTQRISLQEIERTESKIITKATLPDAPVSPKIELNVIVAALMAFLIGIGLSFFMEYLKR